MDKNYWEKFYLEQNCELKPSLFARFVAEKAKERDKKLIELGCGNGRDAVFFANENYNVLAIDQCESEIKFLNARYKQIKNLSFKCEDFTSLDDNEKFGIVYSRFTLHSVKEKQESNVVNWAYRNLTDNGLFCIEVRGQKNELYKKGETVYGENDAYIYDNHYRRFVDFEKLCKKLTTQGFLLDFAEENKGFAPFNGLDEVFIRIIGRK